MLTRQSTIVLYTAPDAMCDQHATIVGRCRQHLARPPSSSGVVNNRSTAVGDYIAFGDGGRAVTKFSKSNILDKVLEGGTSVFGDDVILSLQNSISISIA